MTVVFNRRPWHPYEARTEYAKFSLTGGGGRGGGRGVPIYFSEG